MSTMDSHTASESVSPTAAPPRTVNRFEYTLLRIARFLLGHMPADQGMQLITKPNPTPPPRLSQNCLDLLQDTLRKSLVPYLVRQGGWRRDTYLREGTPRPGRIWERVPLPERTLTFSPAVVHFLHWITTENPTDTKTPLPSVAGMTSGDELFFLRAFETLQEEPKVISSLAGEAWFYGNPWCRLFCCSAFADRRLDLPSFAGLFTPPRVAWLECLMPALSLRWIHSERAKGQLSHWGQMRAIGEQEQLVLSRYLEAARAAGRMDLARFLLKTLQSLLASTEPNPDTWTGRLSADGPTRLRDRLETQRAAFAVVQQTLTLQQWHRTAQAVGYFDDDYAASQLFKADWEQAQGDTLARKAQALLATLKPLRTGDPG